MITVLLVCVSDLTNDAFLAAFDQFTLRRGLPTHVHSDYRTNFMGALNEIEQLILQSQNSLHLASRDVEWHFNPLGGVWEAARKSPEHRISRVIGNHALTFLRHSHLSRLFLIADLYFNFQLIPMKEWIC